MANAGAEIKREGQRIVMPDPEARRQLYEVTRQRQTVRRAPSAKLPDHADTLREVQQMNKRDVTKEDTRPHCKQRPNDSKSKGGGGKGFVPWC